MNKKIAIIMAFKFFIYSDELLFNIIHIFVSPNDFALL